MSIFKAIDKTVEVLNESNIKKINLLDEVIEQTEELTNKYPKLNYRTTGKLVKAGKAIIQYSDKTKVPYRDKDTITIPVSDIELYQLDENFNQFLILGEAQVPGNRNYSTTYRAWFGGTDENPFLVELSQRDWLTSWREDKFYDEIKPVVITKMEEQFGNNKGESKRQGDIFAYRLPQFMQKLEAIEAIMLISGQTTNVYTDFKLFETRHIIKGELAIHYRPNLIGRGTITAPDHKPLVLKEWHILSQTRNLHDPSKAD